MFALDRRPSEECRLRGPTRAKHGVWRGHRTRLRSPLRTRSSGKGCFTLDCQSLECACSQERECQHPDLYDLRSEAFQVELVGGVDIWYRSIGLCRRNPKANTPLGDGSMRWIAEKSKRSNTLYGFRLIDSAGVDSRFLLPLVDRAAMIRGRRAWLMLPII